MGLTKRVLGVFALSVCRVLLVEAITFTPASDISVQEGATNIQFECTPSANRFTSISSIQIAHRSNSGAEYSTVVVASYDIGASANKVVWQNTDVQERGSATGKVYPVADAIMTFTISTIACVDEGEYMCTINGFLTGGATQDDILERKLTVQKTAEKPTVTVEPASAGYADGTQAGAEFGTSLAVKCTGNVGNPPQEIRWCRKGSGSTLEDARNLNDTMVTNGTATQVSGSPCMYSNWVTISLTVTEPQVDFECHIGGTDCTNPVHMTSYSVKGGVTPPPVDPNSGSSSIGLAHMTMLLMSFVFTIRG